MTITSLPGDLKFDADAPIQLFDYRVFESCVKSKISLNINTFSFLKEGVKEVISHQESVRITNDQFLIIKSGHCLMTEKTSPASHVYNSLLLFFSDEVLLRFLEQNNMKSSVSRKSRSYVLGQYDPYIRTFVAGLEKLINLSPRLKRRLLQLKFEEIMLYLIEQQGEAFLYEFLDQQDNQEVRLRNVVENNKLKKLSLQELAFLSNMSVSTFKRAFKKMYETTPIKWFQEQRLVHAAFQLHQHRKRPIDIYEEAGYESLSNFVQAFKQKYHVTPKQFQLKNMSF